MIVTIKRIEEKYWNDKLKNLIYFDNLEGLEQYVEYTEKVTKYWRTYFKDDSFNFTKGMKINVFNVPNQKYYTIKGVFLE